MLVVENFGGAKISKNAVYSLHFSIKSLNKVMQGRCE